MTKKNVLFVVTSHDLKGDSGEKTGLWLAELTHPLHELEAAGHRALIASIQAGKAPVDGDSLNMTDPINAQYWEQGDLQQRLKNAPALADLNGADYDAIFFTGGYGTMWDFREGTAAQRLTRDSAWNLRRARHCRGGLPRAGGAGGRKTSQRRIPSAGQAPGRLHQPGGRGHRRH